MNEALKTELTQAHRDWIRRVLGVDGEQEESEGIAEGRDDVALETSRRGGLRTELRTRARNAGGVTADRLKALTPGNREVGELIARAKRLKADMDQAMDDPELASDTNARDAFDAAATRARLAIDALQAPWPGMKVAGDIQAEARARGKVVVEQFEQHLVTIGKDLEALRPEIGPGELDLKLRDLQNIVYAAHKAPAFARPADAESFEPAFKAASDAFATFKIDAEAALKPMREKAAALRAANQAMTLADAAVDQALRTAGPFDATAQKLVQGLKVQRDKLSTADTPTIDKIKLFADKVTERAGFIGAAGTEALRLTPAVEQAVAAADDTPGGLLQTAWDEALKTAGEQLARGEAAAATVSGIGTLLQSTEDLTAAIALLRSRATTWTETRNALKLAPSKGEALTLAPSSALFGRIRGDVSAIGTLETELAQLEAALEQVATDIGAYLLRRDQTTQAIDRLKTESGWRAEHAQTLRTRIASANEYRANNPAKALQELDAAVSTVDELDEVRVPLCACWELSPAVGIAVPEFARSNKFDSWNQRIGNAIKGKGDLPQVRTEVTEQLGRMRAVKEYLDLFTPYSAQLERLKKSSVNTIARKVKTTTEDALKAAQAGDAERGRGLLQALLVRLDGLSAYDDQGATLTRQFGDKRKNAPPPLDKAVTALSTSITQLINEDRFDEALVKLKAVNALLDGAAAYRKAHATAEPLLRALRQLAPAVTRGTDPAQNDAFALRLDAALTGELAQMAQVADDLVQLAPSLKQAIAIRQQALRSALGGARDDPRTSALFEDDEASQAVTAFLTRPGEAALKALIARLGKPGAGDSLGKAVAKALKDLHKGIGPEGIESLGNALGGVDRIADLCGDEGSAELPNELHKQFASDLPKLTSMVNAGLGGDPARVRGLVGVGKTGATRLKALSDKFVNRAELVTLVGTLGTDAEAKAAMETIAASHFGGEWGKLKDPFFDTLSAQPDAANLMKKAKNFKAASPGTPSQPAHLSGFTSVDMVHTLERHRPENFALGKAKNIKPSQTQFAPGTTPEAIAAIIDTALGLLRRHLDGEHTGAVTYHKTKGTFVKYFVNVADPGVRMQIGYDTVTDKVEQAFPTGTYGAAATITLENFSNVQMNALKTALGK